ncbi:MAG: AmmeMemoRadiSam system protein B [Deltaproteobacteria bacterium]|nr:MAG: AmmeMemoRadiSam system protein B [Deltaproteobacteria bacterium]
MRKPAVAGRFYPGSPAALQQEVRRHLAAGAPDRRRRAVAVMAPHAGYVFSGDVAGKTFAEVEVPDRVIVLCPNHTGLGRRIAVHPAGAFAIPGAQIPIDAELAGRVLARVPGAEADALAHAYEHAIEVELPFLLAKNPRVKVVPIVLAGLSEREAVQLGEALADAAEDVGDRVLVVASSDMSHYLPDAEARRVDRVALAPLLASDPHGLYRTVVANDISMCGFIPATAMLAYAHRTGGGAPELTDYATSGDAFGDRDRVVGYAGVVVPQA